jgi:hypothetical protein
MKTTSVKWRADDKHTGIDDFDGIYSTYRHIAGRRVPPAKSEMYRVEAVIPFRAPTPLHEDVYYVPGDRIDDFMAGWSEIAARIVDIRPITWDEMAKELTAFRKAAQ